MSLADLVSVRRRQPGEMRAPRIATQTVRTLGFGTAMTPEWDAEDAIRWAYYANVFVWACANAKADDLAAVPIRVGADPSKPHDYDLNHPLAQRLGPPPGGPAPGISPRQLIAWSIVQLQITGRLAWELECQNAAMPPVAFWPVPATTVKPIQSNGGSSYFSGYQVGSGSQTTTLQPWQMMYAWRPSAHDWREPESVLQAARLSVNVAVMQDRYDRAFLSNDARPAAIIVHEAFAELDERDAWREDFLRQHRGPDNAGRVHFIESTEDGAEPSSAIAVHQLGMSQRDAQFVERYEAKIRDIVVAFGVPMSRLGDASKRTYSNAGQETTNYWVNGVKPVGEMFCDWINMLLAPRYGANVCWFDWSTVPALKPAPKFAVGDGIALFKARLATAEEVRVHAADLPAEMPDGTMCAAAPTELPASGPAPEAPADEGEPDVGDTEEPSEPVEPAEPAAEATSGETSAADASSSTEVDLGALFELAAARRDRQWRAIDATVSALEAGMQERFARLLDRQRAAVLARLSGKRGRQATRDAVPDADRLFDRVFWTAETSGEARATLTEAAGLAFARIADEFDIELPFSTSTEFVVQLIQARADRLAHEVTDTTWRGVKAALAEGVLAGESIAKLADRIEHLFTVTWDGRAETVARTEVIGAFNEATWTSYAQLGEDIVAGMEWISTRDNRTRDAHRAADGQIAEVGGTFQVGSDRLRFPGDPAGSASNTVRCRCTISAITPDEADRLGVLGRSARPSMAKVLDLCSRLAMRQLSHEDAVRELVGAR